MVQLVPLPKETELDPLGVLPISPEQEAQFEAPTRFPGESVFDEQILTNVNRETGASFLLRSQAGLIGNVADRISFVQSRLPNAQPFGENNFIFPDPQTGQLTLFDPDQAQTEMTLQTSMGPISVQLPIDVGEAADVTREAIEFGAGTAGAIGGAVLGAPGGPPGIVGGSILGAGTGQAAGAEFSTALSRLIGAPDTRTGQEIVRDIGVEFAIGAGGQALLPLAGAGLRGGTRLMLRGNQALATRRLAAFEAAGVAATPSQVTQNPLLRGIEVVMGLTPGSSGVIKRTAQKAQEQLKLFTENRSRLLSGSVADADIAGEALSGAIKGNFIPRFKDLSQRLFDKINQFVPADEAVSVTNFQTLVNELGGAIPGAEALSEALRSTGLNKIIQATAQDIAQTGRLPFEALQALRSRVGSKLGNVGLVGDFDAGELKRLYGALTADIREAAVSRGGAPAVAAFENANKFYNRELGVIEQFLQPLVGKEARRLGGGIAEVFLALERSGKLGAATINAVKQRIPAAQFKLVQAASIRRMGRATNSQQDDLGSLFSSERFLTNWNALPDPTKNALFGSSRLRADIDTIAKVSSEIRESGRMFFNPSGSADRVASNLLFLGGAGGTAVAGPEFLGVLIAAAGGANIASRLWTSQSFVRWLAQSTKIKTGGVSGHFGRLAAIAASSDPVTRDAMLKFLASFGETTEEIPEEITDGR